MPDPLALTLQAAPGPYRVGRPVPVRVEVRNVTGSPVPVVGVLDGSENGLRYPHYLPLVTLDDRVVSEPGPVEDPLVGPLPAAAMTDVGPGEAVDPTAGAGRLPLSTFANFAPGAPGVYRFRLELDASAPDPADWLGRFGPPPDAATLELLSRVPRLRLVADLDVEVVG